MIGAGQVRSFGVRRQTTAKDFDVHDSYKTGQGDPVRVRAHRKSEASFRALVETLGAPESASIM